MVGSFLRDPAFQIERFKKVLHADFNNEFADKLLAVLARRKQTGLLAEFQAGLIKVRIGDETVIGPQQAGDGWQVSRFYHNLTADFCEAFAADLLKVLQGHGRLTKCVYAFRLNLGLALNDNFVPPQHSRVQVVWSGEPWDAPRLKWWKENHGKVISGQWMENPDGSGEEVFFPDNLPPGVNLFLYEEECISMNQGG